MTHPLKEITADTPDYMAKTGYELVAIFRDRAEYEERDWILDVEDNATLVATESPINFTVWKVPAEETES
jgi:hypothetical protein